MSKNAGTIRRLPKVGMGDPDDGVEMMAQCNVMNFKVEKGVVSISVRDGRPFMVSVRLDELMALLKEAADYRNENDQKTKGEENHE